MRNFSFCWAWINLTLEKLLLFHLDNLLWGFLIGFDIGILIVDSSRLEGSILDNTPKKIVLEPLREIRLLIIRNLQSEKTIVNKQEEFYLSKESFLLKRKDFLISRNFLSNLKEFSFSQVKFFLFIDNCLLTLQIPDYQQAFFLACWVTQVHLLEPLQENHGICMVLLECYK